MLKLESSIFENKKPNEKKLISFGFSKTKNHYTYSVEIMDGQFIIKAVISKKGFVHAKIIDVATYEEYVLHRVSAANGAFVGKIKKTYENVLREISEKCFESDVFRNGYAKKVIDYVRNTYGDELEFLWEKFPKNAILRRKDTGKWYAALLVISKQKLGLASDEIVDIIDLRIQPENVEKIVDNKKYFGGYHMNKKHWITICLDGSVSFEEIRKRIDISYELAQK